MSVTIESDLKEYLVRFEQKLDLLGQDTNSLKVGQARLESELKRVEEKINGVDKRLENQEFINRTVFGGIVLALLVGLVKMFYPNFPSF